MRCTCEENLAPRNNMGNISGADVRSGWTLTQVQGEVDRIGVLDAEIHGLALPPSALLVPVEVCQEGGVVAPLRVRCVALVAGARWPRLHAELLRWGAAHVRRHHGAIEGDVLKPGHAAAQAPLLIIAGVHGRPGEEVVAELKGEEKAQERRPPSRGCVHVDSQPFWASSGSDPKRTELQEKQKKKGNPTRERESRLRALLDSLCVKTPTYAHPLEWSKFGQEVLSSGTDRGGPGVGVRPGGQEQFLKTSPPAGQCKHSSRNDFTM